MCCCFSSSICCREKKGRRREGGSSGWRRPHSSKLFACRHRTCRRRFFLCRVLKWQYSQAKGLAPVGTGDTYTHAPLQGTLNSLYKSLPCLDKHCCPVQWTKAERIRDTSTFSLSVRGHSQGHLPNNDIVDTSHFPLS